MISVIPRSFAPILIVILIALAVGGYLLYQKQNEPIVVPQPVTSPVAFNSTDITNWKTLTNVYGFSIRYPSNLKVVGLGPSGDASTISTIGIAGASDAELFYIDARGKEFSGFKNLTLEEIAKQSYEVNVKNNSDAFRQVIEPFELTSLDGKQAYTYTILTKNFAGKWNLWLGSDPSNPVRKLKVVESENKNRHYLLIYKTDNGILDQILSTFKFIQ